MGDSGRSGAAPAPQGRTKEAYQRCLETARYVQKPWAKLLETYADEGDVVRTIQTAIRVAAYQHSDYSEMTVRSLSFPGRAVERADARARQYPTLITGSFFKLGQIHGRAKIAFTLISMGLPEGVLKLMEGYLQCGRTFKVGGCNF